MAAIHLAGVQLCYGSTIAIDDLTLSLGPGATHALIGPSGCGKSTLLKSITGLLTPARGVVRVFDRVVEPASSVAQRVANRATGLVLQDGGLFPHLVVRANIALPAGLAGWPSERIGRRLEEVAALVGLSAELWDRYPRRLSGGQRQRVALARALMLDPALLLLDEPLSALDPPSRAELQDELGTLIRRLGKTVVLVTHDLAEALYLADTITLLDQGRLVQHGPTATVARQPNSAWAAGFIRSAVPRWREMLARVDGAQS